MHATYDEGTLVGCPVGLEIKSGQGICKNNDFYPLDNKRIISMHPAYTEVGFEVGAEVGFGVGFTVGLNVGLRVGFAVGFNVGFIVGFNVGLNVGLMLRLIMAGIK